MSDAPERLVLSPGDVLFVRGEEATAAYLIERGRVRLVGEGGPDAQAERGAGEIVGESAIAGPGPHPVSAVAVEPTDLLVVRREQVSRRLADVDPLLRLCVAAMLIRAGHGELHSKPSDSPWQGHYEAAGERLSAEYQLRRAIARDELRLFFEPIVDLPARQIAGFEALLRWQHPERGLLPPAAFIPMAEASGLISDITALCLRAVGAQFPALAAAVGGRGPGGPPFISINVSGHDLEREDFAASAAGILSDAGLDLAAVRLEITESVLIKNTGRSAATLQQCRDQGLQIAIDDFGTGYSSLTYLGELPVSMLKLDRSFAHSLLDQPNGRKIVEAIIQLGGALGLAVVAEGVERDSEARLLAAMGCSMAQGYLFGRAAMLADTLQRVAAWPGRGVGPLPTQASNA